MRKLFIAVLLAVVASVLVCVPAAMSQTVRGDEGDGLNAFAPFGKEGQILAQATCTAMRPDGGLTFAVQRYCERDMPSCDEVCGNLRERQQTRSLSCFGALHIYANSFFTEYATLGLKTLKQNYCGVIHCGPNYCCCGN